MLANRPASLKSYKRIVVAFSGGKDSLAALLAILEQLTLEGRSWDCVELWHHDVDGGETFMDWPITSAYCQAVADALGLPLFFSYKVGGFLGEMNRDATPTQATRFQNRERDWIEVGGKGKPGTRGLFPQVAADLKVRWCSAYLKIDVMDRAICGQSRFLNSRSLVVTGERAEESSNRAKYKTFEPHRTDNREGSRNPRWIDHWRPVHAWEESDVWAIIRKFGIVPHVAYQLGWGRLSCLSCIFGSANQWATIAAVFPEHLERVALREEASGRTIQRGISVRALAARGTPYAAAMTRPDLVALAMSSAWTIPALVAPEAWTLPHGAYGENAGPT
jgi:3'-phosphoadenosine 5'-phosphosulfate sulfotransferase (PAPS reductase)/FAD synthetase